MTTEEPDASSQLQLLLSQTWQSFRRSITPAPPITEFPPIDDTTCCVAGHTLYFSTLTDDARPCSTIATNTFVSSPRLADFCKSNTNITTINVLSNTRFFIWSAS